MAIKTRVPVYNVNTPTHRALMAMFRRHPHEWVSYEAVYQFGGTNASGRISELRSAGERIDHRGTGKTSEYRYVPKEQAPDNMGYRQFECACGFSGAEPQMVRGMFDVFLCPKCNLPVKETA